MTATRDDLGGLGLIAENHWREYRPNVVKALEAKGTLYDHLLEAEESAAEMMEDLWKQGVDPEARREIALKEFILLPDHDPTNEESEAITE